MLEKFAVPLLTLGAAASLGLTACGSASSPMQDPADTAAHVQTTGLDEGVASQAVEDASRLPALRSLIVMRDGEVEIEQRFNGGPSLDTPVNIKSASKSVISALVGMALERRILESVDQPVVSVLGDQMPASPDPRLGEVTVGNLLSMQAGLERTSGDNYGRWVSSDNWVRYALSRPFVEEPGGAMLYSTGSTHLLSAMLTRASGRSTLELARDWLGEPLDIAIPAWTRDPQGIYLGGNNMAMSPRALVRFGELYRMNGVVNGRRVLPADWIERSWTPRTTSPWSGEEYGYGWFISEAGGYPVRYAWGYGGQMVYVVPGLNLTVVMTSATDVERGSNHIQALHRLLSERIVPAAEAGA